MKNLGNDIVVSLVITKQNNRAQEVLCPIII